MPVITSMKALGRAKTRIETMLDGAPWTTLDAETVVKQGLRTGMRLDNADVELVLAADAGIKARKAAAGLIARGPRTRKELEARLAEKGFKSGAAKQAVERLVESGTHDEVRAIDSVIRRRRRGGIGKLRIEQELRARGADSSALGERMALAMQGVDEAEECKALALKLAKRVGSLEDLDERRKLTQRLMRRGYTADAAHRAVAAARLSMPLKQS